MKKELPTGSDLCWMDLYEPINLPEKSTNKQVINSDDEDHWSKEYQLMESNFPVLLVHFFRHPMRKNLACGIQSQQT